MAVTLKSLHLVEQLSESCMERLVGGGDSADSVDSVAKDAVAKPSPGPDPSALLLLPKTSSVPPPSLFDPLIIPPGVTQPLFNPNMMGD